MAIDLTRSPITQTLIPAIIYFERNDAKSLQSKGYYWLMTAF
jgi:hypothetical protein